jgi:oligopeptide transport system substrate-binding protein
MLRVASVEGENFTAQIVAQVLNKSERDLLWLLTEELEKRHRLVRARGETFFDHQCLSLFEFTHSMFHQYLYTGLNPGQQRLLHGEIAEKLEVIYQGRTDEVAIQLARHFEKARKSDKAIHYLLMAGDQARRFYAQKESIKYYQRALDLLRETDDYDRTARTLMKLGLTYHNAFDFKAARETFQEGFVFWQRLVDEKGEDRGTLPSPPHPLRVTAYEPAILGLGLAMDFPSHVMLDQLYSGLVEVSPEMGLVPDVAQSWEVLDGGRKYIFQLKKDVYWSDGVQVTAWDFECAWQRILAPTSDLRWHVYLTDIKYADAYHNGQITDLDMVGVQALDDYTLVVELEGPTSYFPYLLAFVVGYPVPRHVVEDHGDRWMELDKVVTNGPFRLKSWDKHKALVLERNPTYHGRFMGNLESVECTFLSGQPTKILQRYEEGRLDICGGLPLADFANFRQRFAGEYMSGPWMSTDFIGFDVSRPPFNDVRVRRAFALATDREKLADVILRGYAFPATGGFVPPGMPGHSPGIGLPYDAEVARNLLVEAGFKKGSDLPVVECLARDDPGHDLACDFLQTHWKENLGVEIDWRLIEWGNFYDMVSTDTPHMCLVSWYADYPDPDDFLRILWWFGFTGWQNENYTSLVEGARRVLDQAERLNMYKQADKIIIEEVPLLPLCYGRFHMLVKPWVKKLFTSPLKWWSWKDVIIEHH